MHKAPKLITLSQRLSLWLLRVPVAPIVEARRQLLEVGYDVAVAELGGHHLAGGDVREVSAALTEARRLQVELDFPRACALDLARDRADPAQRSAALVQLAATPREVLFDEKGPMEFRDPGKFTWRPRLMGILKLNLTRYLEGADEDLIAMRLKLSLHNLYREAGSGETADRLLSGWLGKATNLPALAEGTKHTVLDLRRVL
jgi:uncharacterized protein YqfA (UPF0365 family)